MNLSCPIPIRDYPTVTLAHGGGGSLMRSLIEKMIAPAFDSRGEFLQHDSAVLPRPEGRIAMTTDSFVVRPLFFPGGDIGSLAINGTVNDLAMVGARPLYLTCGFILEEGLPMETLWRVIQSLKTAAEVANVKIVTGDTKVVDNGKGDGIFVNTSGVGVLEHDLEIHPRSIRPGDAILINGDIGRHGIAIMAVREGLSFETTIESDCAPLAATVQELLSAKIPVHCLRDCTRGGLASALAEISATAKRHIEIDEASLSVREDVRGACEILGLDPMYIANEGRFVAFVPQEQAATALEILRRGPGGENAAIIGRVSENAKPIATLRSRLGSTRIIDLLSGEQLPRIC